MLEIDHFGLKPGASPVVAIAPAAKTTAPPGGSQSTGSFFLTRAMKAWFYSESLDG
jgi:hypothetical protein